MPTVMLQWEMVNAQIDEYDLAASEDADLIGRVEDAKQVSRAGGTHADVAQALGPLNFEWSWSNCDADASEMIEDPQDISFELDDTNSEVIAAEYMGQLLIRCCVQFAVEVRPGVTPDSLNQWLDENSVAICAYASGGWSYAGDEGQRVEVISP